MMSRGRIVASGTLAEVRSLMQIRPLTVEIVAEPARRLAALLAENPDVQGVELRDSALIVRTRNPLRVLRARRRAGVRARHRRAAHANARRRRRRGVRLLAAGTAMNLLRAWTTLVWLTFRRLLWSASTLMVLLPLAGCLLFVLRRHYHRLQACSIANFNDFSEFMILVFASFVVPICALAFGTASIGGDREDRTLVFLLVRPMPRALVLLAKFTATLPLVLGLVVGSFWLYCRLAGEVGQLAFALYLPALVVHDAWPTSACFICSPWRFGIRRSSR